MTERIRSRQRGKGTTGGGGLLGIPSSFPAGSLQDAVSYWALEESSGARYDSIGRFHLTRHSGAGSATGKRGQALDPAGTYIARSGVGEVGINMGVSGVGASWSCWFKKAAIPGTIQGVFGSWTQVGAYNFATRVVPTGAVNASVRDSLNTTFTVTRVGSVCDGLWHFICLTFDPGDRRTRLYFDKESPTVSGSQSTVTTVSDNPEGISIGGGSSGTNPMQEGLVDEAAMWNRCLTATEIAILYASY